MIGGLWIAYQTLSVRSQQEKVELLALRAQVETLNKQDQQLGLSLKRTQERRFQFDTRARIQKLGVEAGEGVYYVEYAYVLQNTSDVRLHMQYAIIDLYLGERDSKSASGSSVFPVNSPLQTGSHLIAWKRLGWQIFQDRFATEWGKKNVQLAIGKRAKTDVMEEGASLLGGESARFIRPYIVRAKPGTWVGFVVSYGIDQEERCTTDYYDLDHESKQLTSTTQQALSNTR